VNLFFSLPSQGSRKINIRKERLDKNKATTLISFQKQNGADPKASVRPHNHNI
jgi:hypothetical protein